MGPRGQFIKERRRPDQQRALEPATTLTFMRQLAQGARPHPPMLSLSVVLAVGGGDVVVANHGVGGGFKAFGSVRALRPPPLPSPPPELSHGECIQCVPPPSRVRPDRSTCPSRNDTGRLCPPSL